MNCSLFFSFPSSPFSLPIPIPSPFQHPFQADRFYGHLIFKQESHPDLLNRACLLGMRGSPTEPVLSYRCYGSGVGTWGQPFHQATSRRAKANSDVPFLSTMFLLQGDAGRLR